MHVINVENVYNNPINNQTLAGHPYIFNSSLSNNQPYGYENSDLKNIYLSRKELDLQKRILKYNLNLEEKTFNYYLYIIFQIYFFILVYI